MANNVRLLLVDDNPMVLGLLRGALTPLAMVTTATDAPTRSRNARTSSAGLLPGWSTQVTPGESASIAEKPR